MPQHQEDKMKDTKMERLKTRQDTWMCAGHPFYFQGHMPFAGADEGDVWASTPEEKAANKLQLDRAMSEMETAEIYLLTDCETLF